MNNAQAAVTLNHTAKGPNTKVLFWALLGCHIYQFKEKTICQILILIRLVVSKNLSLLSNRLLIKTHCKTCLKGHFYPRCLRENMITLKLKATSKLNGILPLLEHIYNY